jgi:hypothetical protein
MSESHDWMTPKNVSWVESVLGGVRMEVPSTWRRRCVGTRTLLVSAPDHHITVGMVAGGGASCFFHVVKRVVSALSQTRVWNHTLLNGTSMDGIIIHGTGVTQSSSMEWFVARLGDAQCGVVIYGVGPHGNYPTHFEALNTMVRSAEPLCGDLTVRGPVLRSA